MRAQQFGQVSPGQVTETPSRWLWEMTVTCGQRKSFITTEETERTTPL